MGVGYDKFGAPWNPTAHFGDNYMISKAGRPNIYELRAQRAEPVERRREGQASQSRPAGRSSARLETGFDPYSLQLANGVGAQYENNLVPLPLQSSSADSSRAGQWDNSQAFGGISNTTFGTLTFGRENTLLLDGVNSYDPMGGSYAFSVIGFSGTTAGGGNTEDTRSNTAFKYRVSYNNFRAAGMVQVGGYEQGNGAAQLYQAQVGFDAYGFSFDAIGSYAQDSDQLGTIQRADHASGARRAERDDLERYEHHVARKYTWNQLTLYGGFEAIEYQNPTSTWKTKRELVYRPSAVMRRRTRADSSSLRSISKSSGRARNMRFTPELGRHGRLLPSTIRSSTSHLGHIIASCSNTSHYNCAGTMDAVSALIDYRFGFAKKFDVYAGAMFSQVNNGLANGYQPGGRVNIDPTVGLRFRF